MRSRGRLDGAGAYESDPSSPTRSELGDLGEIQPVAGLCVCPECLVVNEDPDRYCTNCGAALPLALPASADGGGAGAPDASAAALPDELTDLPLPSPLPSTVLEPRAAERDSTPRTRRQQRQVVVGILAAVILAGLAGSGAFAWLWHGELNHRRAVSRQLTATRVDLANSQQTLRATRARLDATTQLSRQRKAVLLRAQGVLASVDPLLSSVDDLQSKTSDIQAGRDTFASAANALMSDSIVLANYLINTDPAYIDVGYEQALIDTANADLVSVRADESSLSGYDASYNAASGRFATRADAFTKAVRQLQTQLRQVASK